LSKIESERYRALGELKGDNSMLGKVTEGDLPGQKIVFGIAPDSGRSYRMESYVISGNKIFVYKTNLLGDNEYDEPKLAKLKSASKLLSSRSENEIPQSPGLCIDGGFVSESPLLTHENFSVGIRLAEFPDVHFSIATTKKEFFHDSDALEPRLRAAEEEAKLSGFGSWYSRIKILRQGNATIEHWNGYEVLARKPAQADQKEAYEFAFLSQGEPKNPYLPLLDIKLHSGVSDNKTGLVKTSISDDDAVVLWDKLTQSIRTRPVK
ncbi:MAG: T6SS immunity protein Tli4 family protein, partial [Duganella sp.]